MDGFGERLRKARGSDSQAAFARKLGISQVAYSRYELGQREPGLDCLYQIGIITGVSADWLLGLPERGGSTTVSAGDGAYPPAQQPEGAARRGAVSLGSGNATASNCRDCPILLDFINRRSGGRK